jgi:mono/diheme cytochrome c family protein
VSQTTEAKTEFFRQAPASMLGWNSLKKAPMSLTIKMLIATAVVAGFIPLAWAARERARDDKKSPRIHLIQDMDNQTKVKAQDPSPLFADGRGNRPRVPGTVARNELNESDAFHKGYTTSKGAEGKDVVTFVEAWPDEIQAILNDSAKAKTFLDRGQLKFNIACAQCHGKEGLGNGPIHQRAIPVGAGATGWVQPTNINVGAPLSRPVGHIYNTINNGIRSMGAQGHVIIDPKDRWAVVAYVRTLQLAHNAPPALAGQKK